MGAVRVVFKVRSNRSIWLAWEQENTLIETMFSPIVYRHTRSFYIRSG